MKQMRKVITFILARVLVTGMFTCLADGSNAYAASTALKNARQKAENSLVKTYNSLADTKAYTEANYKNLKSVKEAGIKKINAAKSKKSVSKALKKYTSKLKKVKYMQPVNGVDRKVTLGANGVVVWKAIKGAVKYRVEFLEWRGCPILDHEEVIKETYVKLEAGGGVYIHPILSDGSEDLEYYSDYYRLEDADKDSEESNAEANAIDYTKVYLSDGIKLAIPVVDESKLCEWNAFEKIYTKSVKKNKDGSVYFETKGPNNEKIRFYGEDVDVKSDRIILHEQGRIIMTDGIGRIVYMIPVVSAPGSSDNMLCVYGGYNIDYDMHPGTIDRMIFGPNSGRTSDSYIDDGYTCIFSELEPNFGGFGLCSWDFDLSYETPNKDDIEVTDFIIKYYPDEECTPFKALLLEANSYWPYLEGEKYDIDREYFDPYDRGRSFALHAVPDLLEDRNELPLDILMEDNNISGWTAEASAGHHYTIGDLKNSKGKTIKREGGIVEKGTTITVYLGDNEFDVPLRTIKVYTGANNMHDLVPYAYPKAEGKKNVLVIPIVWQDDKKQANNENLDILKKKLGKAAKLGEKIKDYSEDNENGFSLSTYFEKASYGKLKLESYYTDWYTAPYNFDEMEGSGINVNFIGEVLEWLYKKYPDTDFSVFDPDKNGYFDHIMFVNYGDMSSKNGYTMAGFGGAVNYRCTYGMEYAGTAKKPGINCVVNMNSIHLVELGPNTLIHEFSHGLGLIDYYDVTYKGIDAVGGYDMQSDNAGDWNAYSKYAVGWIEPEVVTGLKKGESKEIEIGTLSDTGDAIVIPVAGDKHKPPFSEYMMVDLYASTGVNKYDSVRYGINDFEGVRIYHVDAVMERRDYQNSDYPDVDPTPIGTIHFGNNYKPDGRFNIELIQAGADNTFTDRQNLRTMIAKEDFFQTGDKFTMEKYSEFFKDGLMDFGDDFGYEIEVVSITGTGSDAKAKIRITRK